MNLDNIVTARAEDPGKEIIEPLPVVSIRRFAIEYIMTHSNMKDGIRTLASINIRLGSASGQRNRKAHRAQAL
jgi:hypothetical protein